MAASRRGQPPLSVRLPQPSAAAVLTDLPPISALFLIDFDVKAGYTIVWKQAVSGLELEGTVEYKSLPSGLHTVSDDLIYFVHDAGHAGLSAFVNTPTGEEETRHARMVAAGVLVPLSYGRLGRAWRHAEALKDLAAKLAADRKQTQLLANYWEQHAVRETTAPQPLKDTPLESPVLSIKASNPGLDKGHVRNRSASDGAALIPPGHRLSPFHPAWSLTSLLDTFGPLIFPIHRAALLRKRILISCHAPVHEICNFVYDISVLSNVPLSVCDVIDPSAPVQRLRPLFTVGVHDISSLLENQAGRKRSGRGDDPGDTGSGWVACTTDSILATKEGLWDMLITMPPPHTSNAKHRVWPTVESPKGVPVKATQRDLRRFRCLTMGLRRFAAARAPRLHPPPPNSRSPASDAGDSPVPAIPTIRSSKPSSASRPGTAATHERPPTLSAVGNGSDDTDKIIESTTWAALAYNGFMWWASAGEKRHSEEMDEQSHDAALLEDLMAPTPASPVMGGSGGPTSSRRRGAQGQGQEQGRSSFGAATTTSSSGGMGMADSLAPLPRQDGDGADDEDDEDARAQIELAVVAYFHRLTTSVLSVLADIVDSSEDDDNDDLLDLDVDPNAELDGPVSSLSGGEHDRGSREEEARLLGGSGNSSSSRGWVRVDSQALAEMGLDIWSQADADFVRELAARYFSRRAYVETKGFEICGVRVC